MKVRIEDKEALEALSWESLKAYLDRSKDWMYAEDIPGKAAVYQHTDSNGRLWEILVLLRDDLADYVSRMADAVSILARVEDRSELDVYNDLANSPAETACKVHTRIRKWLAEEGWQIREVETPETSFNIMAMLPSGTDVNIFQLGDHVDHITLSQHWFYSDEVRSVIGLLPSSVLRDVVWNIYRDVSIMGVEFFGIDTPTTEMTLRTSVYFDGLNKDTLVQRVFLTIRALALAQQIFVRALETHRSVEEASIPVAPEASADAADPTEAVASTESTSSPARPIPSREVLKQIMRRVPQADPLTLAS